MGNRSGEKIKFTSFDDLFGAELKVEPEENQVVRIGLSELHPFKNHPFRVLDNEEMLEMAESVKEYGVLVPAIVRKDDKGGYEIVAGHRRKRASELAGLEDIPAIIRNMTDDEAVIVMVDSNIQRQDILPSEKAKAYRMKMEALNHQGKKGGLHTAAVVGKTAGDSVRTVHRYVRLSYLKPELMEYVDQKQLSIMTAEELSFLNDAEQDVVQELMSEKSMVPSKGEAEILKAESGKGTLTSERIREVLTRQAKPASFTIPAKRMRDYFPDSYTKEQVEDIIYRLLDSWRLNEKETNRN